MSVEAFGNGSRGSRSRAGTPSRRRLSGRMVLTPLGSNAVGNNDRAEKMNRRRREARRRSGRFTPIASGMGARSQNVTDEDITAQVSQTIKLHVENKISEKNAFSLPLGGMLKSTNTKFERASMILEAGTMIYGKRVDSTLVDSLKVRENLLRTKTAEADKPKGVIKTNVSKKVCVTSTIEKNLANITETKRNQAFAVDPLFRQMSMKFDNGGAQGMLLNSLPVKQGCFVAFDSSQALFSQPTVEEEQVGDVEDQSQITVPAALLGGFRQAVARMGSIPTCSALLDVLYNEAAADEPFKQSGNDTVIQSTAQVEAEMSTRNFEPTDWDTTDTGADVDCDGDYDDFDGGDDDEYLNHLASGPATEGAESSPAFDFWSSDYSSSTFSAGRRVVDIEVAIRESGLNDYTFFDSKFNRRAAASKKSKKSTAQTDGRKQKKSKFFFDFLAAVKKASETTPEDVVHVFAAPDNPKKLQLSSRAVTAKIGDYVLPEQPHLKLGEMTRLFLNSKLSLACKIVAPVDEVLGGENYDDYGDDFGDDCGDDEDGLVDDRVNFEASAPESGNRLACLNGYADLIDEEPQVENISLAYETIAKRVDVRQLKQNLWKKVMPLKSDETTDDQSEGEEDAAPAEKCESLSFTDTMAAVKDSVPNNVTVSYYFICMLHLANEKGLEFKGRDDLEDFEITK